ncbi:hypothetical protein DW201_17110, partial [Enterococcus casseliflavus]
IFFYYSTLFDSRFKTLQQNPFGYFLYKQGTKTEIIQSLLNHSSQRETLRYIGITQEDKDTAVKSLDL